MGLVVLVNPGADGPREASLGSLATQEAEPSAPEVSPNESRRPKAISTSTINSLAADLGQDAVRYYADQTGAAFSVDLRTGTAATLSDRRLPGFIQSWWIQGKRQVVSEFEVKGAREFRFYDYESGAVTLLGEGTTAFAVSPDGTDIAYITGNAASPEIRVIGVDGEGDRRIISTRASLAQISWPRSDTIAVTSHRHDRAGADMSLVALDGSFRKLFEGRENLEYRWSPDGRRLLLSYFVPNEGIRLWYRDFNSQFDAPLPLATSAQKCAWHPDSTAVTCGVPSRTELARDIPSDMMATSDDIVTVTLDTLVVTPRFSAEQKTPLGVTGPVITGSGRYFAFVNLFDRRLYFLGL